MDLLLFGGNRVDGFSSGHRSFPPSYPTQDPRPEQDHLQSNGPAVSWRQQCCRVYGSGKGGFHRFCRFRELRAEGLGFRDLARFNRFRAQRCCRRLRPQKVKRHIHIHVVHIHIHIHIYIYMGDSQNFSGCLLRSLELIFRAIMGSTHTRPARKLLGILDHPSCRSNYDRYQYLAIIMMTTTSEERYQDPKLRVLKP